LGAALFAIAQPALAVDQTTIDQVVNVAKIGCLLGNEFTFDTKANGDISFTKLKPELEPGIHANLKDDPGAPEIIDQQLKIVATQQIRNCMKPYVQKLEELILGQASGNQITSIDALAALDLGQCPEHGVYSLWRSDPDRTFRCSCPAVTGYPLVTGTSVYDLSSRLCPAAIHAGVLKLGQPGQILVRLVPAPPVFKSSTQNGIRSNFDTALHSKYGFVVSAYPPDEGRLVGLRRPPASKVAARGVAKIRGHRHHGDHHRP
jgi:hypothetical protein